MGQGQVPVVRLGLRDEGSEPGARDQGQGPQGGIKGQCWNLEVRCWVKGRRSRSKLGVRDHRFESGVMEQGQGSG